ncbi:MAG: SPOR domain-containing protein [Rhizonema sp. PD37]|nr:SPOR domain-containing protein [Rhizonema sp. PD37]
MNIFSSNPSYSTVKSIIPLILGGCLALISYPTPVKGQINTKGVLLAQRPSVYQNLPPAPPIPGTGFNDDLLPALPTSSPGYTTPQRFIDFQAAPSYQNNRNRGYTDEQAAPSYQNNRNGRYLVYVDSNNFQRLQQVYQIEPGAYIRRFQGRYIIQAGVFNRESNAKERLRQLRSYGINDARLVNFSNRREISYSPSQKDFVRHQSKSYYVAIPVKSQDLPFMEDKIRRSVGFNTSVSTRNHPRGLHVAVGPFNQYLDAEAWNNYLQKQGFANARVYYGR